MRFLVAGLAAFALLAGCLDDAGPTTDATVPPEGPAVVLDWANETVSGSVASIGSPVFSANPAGLVGEQIVWEFSVPANASRLVLEFSGSANLPTTEADLQVFGPDCEVGLQTDCVTEVTTEGLAAELTVEAPRSGTWQFRLFVETGADEVVFDLLVASLAPAQEG